MSSRRLPAALSVLAERDFRVVWLGEVVSMTGTWMQHVAQSLLVLSLWNSPMALGLVSFGGSMPTALVMLFGGVVADRVDKRRIIIATQLVMAALAVVVGALVASGHADYWMIGVVAVVLGIAVGYDLPAYSAYLPELMPPRRIAEAVALHSATFHGTRMIGPALAGIVIPALGVAAAYFLNAASFLPVVASLLLVRRRRPADVAPRRSTIDDLRDGLRYARARPALGALLALQASSSTFLFPTLAILSPYWVTDMLHGSAGTLGAAWTVSGITSVVGAFTIVQWPARARPRCIWAVTLLGPAAMAIMALGPSLPLALAAFGALSLATASLGGIVQAMIQESTPPELRGRVMALYGLSWAVASPVAGLAASALAGTVGLSAVMVASAVLAVALQGLVLARAAGGIRRVVDECADAYGAVLDT